MNEEIKTEDIIKSLRTCNEIGCEGCKFVPFGPGQCVYNLLRAAADRLEQLRGALTATDKEGYYVPVAKTCKSHQTMHLC